MYIVTKQSRYDSVIPIVVARNDILGCKRMITLGVVGCVGDFYWLLSLLEVCKLNPNN